MKKTICLYFQIHSPRHLRKYSFFDIGKRHDYFDYYVNSSTIKELAEKCYLPANELLLQLIKQYGKQFKVAFSISGSALRLLKLHTPEVIESFQKLAETGNVEFLAETYSHSLSSLHESEEFEYDVKTHKKQIEKLFHQNPKVFRNSSLIYSDEIGKRVHKMGFEAMITDGAKHILGWKSPNFIYTNPLEPKLKLLLKNSKLSDDISLRFSDKNWNEYPLTADKYTHWLNESVKNTELVNLFMNYETFGKYQPAESGIFEFLKHLPEHLFNTGNFEFLTPFETLKKHQPIAPLHVPYPISWSDEERDITRWLGNELQNEAFNQLFQLQKRVAKLKSEKLSADYSRLQASNHFYYMSTKIFSDSDFHRYDSPYNSPYEAYINYMNVLSDFTARIEKMEKKKKKS